MTDTQAVRLPSAIKMGATAVVDALKDGDSLVDMEADVLIECSGSMQALETGIRALRGGAGPSSSACRPRAARAVPLALVQWREIELTGTFRYANTYPTAVAMASAGTVPLDDLVTGHYTLAQVEEALTAGRRDPLAVKPVVLPGS